MEVRTSKREDRKAALSRIRCRIIHSLGISVSVVTVKISLAQITRRSVPAVEPSSLLAWSGRRRNVHPFQEIGDEERRPLDYD